MPPKKKYRFEGVPRSNREQSLSYLLSLVEKDIQEDRARQAAQGTVPSHAPANLPDDPQDLYQWDTYRKELGRVFGSLKGGLKGMTTSAARGRAEYAYQAGLISAETRESILQASYKEEAQLAKMPQLKGWGHTITSGVASSVPYLVPPLVGSLAGPKGSLAGIAVAASRYGAPSHLDQQIQRRISPALGKAAWDGASPEEIMQLRMDLALQHMSGGPMAAGAALGVGEAVPIARGVSYAGKIAKGVLRGKVYEEIVKGTAKETAKELRREAYKKIAKGAIRESGEEGAQEGLSELAHQALNPAERMDLGAAVESAKGGAAVGGILGGSLAAGATSLQTFQNRKAGQAAKEFVKEAGLPETPEVMESIKEDLKHPPSGESAGSELKDEASRIPNEAIAEVDEIVEGSGLAPDVDEMAGSIQEDFTKLEDTLSEQGETMEVLGDTAPEKTETNVPIPEIPTAEDIVERYKDAADKKEQQDRENFTETNRREDPEEQEQLEEGARAIQDAQSPEELEEGIKQVTEVVGEDPVIPPEPETRDEIEDLSDQETEAAASEGAGPEEVIDGRDRLPGDERSAGDDGSATAAGDRGIKGKEPRKAGAGGAGTTSGAEGDVVDRPAGSIPQPGRIEGQRGKGESPRVSVKKGVRARYAYELPSGPGSVRPRSKIANLQGALDVLGNLTEEGREPTSDELDVLAGYGGWGSSEAAAAFRDYADKREKAVVESLRSIGGEEAVAGARRSTQNAHYTSLEIARAMWNAFGASGNVRGTLLEPGAGVGVFAGTIRPSLDPLVKVRMIERDPVSSRIAKILHPSDAVSPTDLSLLDEENTVDGAIGNVPFGDGPLYVDGKGYKLHDGVIIKTLKAVRPGGVAMLISSRGTMDKIDARARNRMSKYADLVAAVRLPESSFVKDAGTSVVTDVLVFQKRLPGEDPNVGWLKTQDAKYGEENVRINEFFLKNESAVLGTPSLEGTMYRANLYTVKPFPGVTIESLASQVEEQLRDQIKKSGVVFQPRTTQELEPPVKMDMVDEWLDVADEPIGSLTVGEGGEIFEVVKTVEEKQTDGTTVKKNLSQKVTVKRNKEKIKRLIELRRGAMRISKMQEQGADEKVWKEEQQRVGKILEGFWKKWGPVNKELRRSKTVTLTREDGTEYQVEELTSVSTPNKPKVFERSSMANYASVLESYDHDTGKASKGRWLTGLITEKVKSSPKPGTLQDAAILSLTSATTRGTIDPEWIAKGMAISREDAEKQLRAEGLAYYSPAEGWMLRNQFLSGDVRTRLQQVQDAKLLEETQVLKDNQPAWIPRLSNRLFHRTRVGCRRLERQVSVRKDRP